MTHTITHHKLNSLTQMNSKMWLCEVNALNKIVLIVKFVLYLLSVEDQKGCNVKWVPDKKTHLGVFCPLMAGAKEDDVIKNLPMKVTLNRILHLFYHSLKHRF